MQQDGQNITAPQRGRRDADERHGPEKTAPFAAAGGHRESSAASAGAAGMPPCRQPFDAENRYFRADARRCAVGLPEPPHRRKRGQARGWGPGRWEEKGKGKGKGKGEGEEGKAGKAAAFPPDDFGVARGGRRSEPRPPRPPRCGMTFRSPSPSPPLPLSPSPPAGRQAWTSRSGAGHHRPKAAGAAPRGARPPSPAGKPPLWARGASGYFFQAIPRRDAPESGPPCAGPAANQLNTPRLAAGAEQNSLSNRKAACRRPAAPAAGMKRPAGRRPDRKKLPGAPGTAAPGSCVSSGSAGRRHVCPARRSSSVPLVSWVL